ncbi:MAG: class I SAM-dependent methyltransferase [Planctomycetes bacterium]|nr:class I SAM-dependent methyltransferase [Planctomycetota bacterium]
MLIPRPPRVRIRASLVFLSIPILSALVSPPALPAAERPARGARREGRGGRAGALEAICEHLDVGEGAVIADIGCGNGADSAVFARIVGPTGTVFSEEIEEGKVRQVRDLASREGLPQITPVLGQTEDPRLPNASCDLIYMHFVFHHFAKPRDMLASFIHDLKPGGHLVIVDRQKGPLRDWIDVAEREKTHRWTSETAVVRQARETGFLFADLLDDLWSERDAFVLVFRRPTDPPGAEGELDLPSPLDARSLVGRLPIERDEPPTIAVVALDRGRTILRDLREALGPEARLVDIVPEEWRETKDEVPPLPSPDLTVEHLWIEGGDLKVPEGMIFDGVIFADAYHRIWDPGKLLATFREKLSPEGAMAIIDRKGPDEEPRRVAGHRRRIGPDRTRRELEAAGFRIAEDLPAPSPDRFALLAVPRRGDDGIHVRETDDAIEIDNGAIAARIRTKGYVSGIEAGMRDFRTGARSLGFGLHIMDFLLGPGWREDGYPREPKIHGNLPKHYEEGPQICTQAQELPATIIRGPDFVAVKLAFAFTEGHAGHGAGSRWEQTIVFPKGTRYVLSAEEITCANAIPGLFYRIDMPGHLRHRGGDTFSEIYLSYHGRIEAKAFLEDFGPDERFLYRRASGSAPDRFIRAYRTRLDGEPGPWVAGMTFDPGRVCEAWCHQRGYVCFIQEIGGTDVEAGKKIGAAYAVGFFDSIEEMERVYDRYRGKHRIAVGETGFSLQ